MELSTQHSAGGLVFRHAREHQHGDSSGWRGGKDGAESTHSDIEICMVKDSYGHWTFPKGHIEQEETLQEAAGREISEETGLDESSLTLVAELGEVSYHFISTFSRDDASEENPKKIHKYVTYYLFRLDGEGQLTAQEGEIEEIMWVPLHAVMETNEYEDNVPIVKAAERYFAGHK